jgi:tau tubulin kinase
VEGANEKIQLLKMEAFVLLELSKAKKDRHFCRIEDRGRKDDFLYVVMTLAGKSLMVHRCCC